MTLILLRHGESEWNSKGLFCGWVDVGLTDSIESDSTRASQLISHYLCDINNDSMHDSFDICYTSVLKRSIKTAHYILNDMNQLHIPLIKSWRLNERFYGDLTGKSKLKMVDKYGKKQIKIWRRSYNIRPPKMENNKNIYHPINDVKYHKLTDFDIHKDIPSTEALIDVIERINPLWIESIIEDLKKKKNVFVCIHGTSVRAIITLIEQKCVVDNASVDMDILSRLEIPNGYPIAYRFDEKGNCIKPERELMERQDKLIGAKINGSFLGDLDKLVNAQKKVENQIVKTSANNKNNNHVSLRKSYLYGYYKAWKQVMQRHMTHSKWTMAITNNCIASFGISAIIIGTVYSLLKHRGIV